MPTETEVSTMLAGLISSGLDFVEKSIKELDPEPQFSVAHFATGVELLLKSRLFAEHWALVSATPHNTPWSAIKAGNFSSVQASDLTKSLTSITATPLSKEQEVFQSVFDHRNQAVHFVPRQNVGEIAAEQFRSWYHLHKLLTDRWSDVYASHAARIATIDASLRAHRVCLQVRFEELAKAHRFDGPAHAARLIDCPVCAHASGILDDAEEHLTALTCPVCVSDLEMANFGCGHWHVFSDGIYDDIRCDCGATHGASDLASIMDENAPLRWKDQLIEGDRRAHCGECLSSFCVVERGGGYRCYACGETFQDDAHDRCGWCNEAWVGYDCSDSGWGGCEFCDGHAGHIAAKDD